MNETTKKAITLVYHYKMNQKNKVDEYLDELEFLAHTANIETIKRFKQRLEKNRLKIFSWTRKNN
jgi:50S ribosomal subunit-associated GTPase HflX